jgi:tetratricopeptide (TPR) repeat protein
VAAHAPIEPTPLAGISYFQPAEGYRLTGRDGAVDLAWPDLPVPLLEDDYRSVVESGAPTYDQVGRGIFQALRVNPDCASAAEYATILQQAYPHVIAEIGGEAIMLDAKEVDTPYLDRKVTLLKIMALMEPANAGLPREIGRTLMEKGSRLDALHLAVQAWYGAEKHLQRSLELEPEELSTGYQLGETHYVLGHYDQALAVWEPLLPRCGEAERVRLTARVEAIRRHELPKVPPVDYLTALAVALEQRQDNLYETVAIIEDVLADQIFCAQFPMMEVTALLEQFRRELNLATPTPGRC